jgi:hypothetical protein
MDTIKLNEVIGWDGKEFVIGTHTAKGQKRNTNDVAASYTAKQVDELMAQVFSSGDKEMHRLFAAQIVEPIMQVVPYQELYNGFFMDVTYGELDDNSIPVEDLPTIAYETHQDGQVLMTRAGYSFTRPGWLTWDSGVEVSWEMARKAGWNFLSRQMNYMRQDFLRKHDTQAKAVLDAAIPSAAKFTVSGGKLTQVGVNQVLKYLAGIGFPARQALVNPATLMDMATFTFGGTSANLYTIAPDDAKQMLRELFISDYGNVEWKVSPFAKTGFVYFGGAAQTIGWHQMRGSMKNASDVDIVRKLDQYVMIDAEHSYYVGNANSLATLEVTS